MVGTNDYLVFLDIWHWALSIKNVFNDKSWKRLRDIINPVIFIEHIIFTCCGLSMDCANNLAMIIPIAVLITTFCVYDK